MARVRVAMGWQVKIKNQMCSEYIRVFSITAEIVARFLRYIYLKKPVS
jgi:hypothetical protein